jgi:hypothetical protein
MSGEVFLLFAIAVIYCVISFRDLQAETSVSGKREQSMIGRARRRGPGISKSD